MTDWKDKIGTQTLAKVKDGSEISATKYHDLLRDYWTEVGLDINGPTSRSDLVMKTFHRERFCALLGQKNVKLNFAIKGLNRYYERS